MVATAAKLGNPIQLIDGNVAVDERGPVAKPRAGGAYIAMHIVVGDMGFLHSATVPAEGPAVPFMLTHVMLTHAIFERVRRGRPDLTNAFDDVGILTDRIDNRDPEVAALGPAAS
jgi:hypothetical protein